MESWKLEESDGSLELNLWDVRELIGTPKG